MSIMSVTATNYAQFLLSEHFGPTAVAVTRLMRTKGPVLLLEIMRDCSDLTAIHVGRCLKSLIRHMLIRVKKTTSLKYELNYPLIFCIPRFPLFAQLVLHFYGKVAEDLIFYLFLMGQSTVSDLVKRCLASVTESSGDARRHEYAESLGNSLDTLIRTGVLSVQQPIKTDKQVQSAGDTFIDSSAPIWKFTKNEICEALHKYVSTRNPEWIEDSDAGEPEKKRKRISNNDSSPWSYVVCPNISALETMWRDRLIFQLARERLGETCGDLMSHLLCIAAAAQRKTEITSIESGAVSRNEVMRSLRNVPEFFDSHLSLLVEDEIGFLVQEQGLSGYMYICPYKQVIKHMMRKHAEHVVQVLFQNSGLRIFRLLILCGPLNHEELERRVLLPQKDFRRTLPRMIAAGFIATTELSRSKEFTSETIICLYSVNLTRIANLLIELAQHAALRIALRFKYEFEQKKRLIEQRYRVETMIQKHQSKLTQLTEAAPPQDTTTDDADDTDYVTQHKESLEALKSSITPAEQSQLTNLSSKLAKLVSSEHEAHVAWFVSELYLRLHSEQKPVSVHELLSDSKYKDLS